MRVTIISALVVSTAAGPVAMTKVKVRVIGRRNEDGLRPHREVIVGATGRDRETASRIEVLTDDVHLIPRRRAEHDANHEAGCPELERWRVEDIQVGPEAGSDDSVVAVDHTGINREGPEPPLATGVASLPRPDSSSQWATLALATSKTMPVSFIQTTRLDSMVVSGPRFVSAERRFAGTPSRHF